MGWSREVPEEETGAETERGQPWLKRRENLLDRTTVAVAIQEESRSVLQNILEVM